VHCRGSSDRLRRFEQEARSVGALNHPNRLVLFDVGTHAGSPYLGSEGLEGSTLRGVRACPAHRLAQAGTDAIAVFMVPA